MPEIIQLGGLVLRFLHDRHGTGGSLDMFEMDIAPQARMPVPHYHRNWDETVYGLAGTVTFTLSGTPHSVGPGQTLFIPRGTVHGFDNRGTVTATCLCVLTPGILGPEYFREIAALLSSGGPPDPAAIGAIMQRHGLVPAPQG